MYSLQVFIDCMYMVLNLFKIFETIPIKDGILIEDGIQQHFKLPIEYLETKYEINDSLIADIELCNDGSHNVLYQLMAPYNSFNKCNVQQHKNYYTTDIEYLQNTQHIIQHLDTSEYEKDEYKYILDIWKDTKQNQNFLYKYAYMDWKILQFLNANTLFLTFSVISTLLTPILFFIVPVIILIIPYLILKFKGTPITFDQYYQLLKVIGRNHFIGKLLNGFGEYSIKSIGTTLFYIGTFIYQVYSNIQSCRRYYENMKTVKNNVYDLSSYLERTIENIQRFTVTASVCLKYDKFIHNADKHASVLRELRDKIKNVTPFEHSIGTVIGFGDVLKQYYCIFENEEYEKSLCYSFGFNGYLENIYNIKQLWYQDKIHFAEFNQNKETEIIQQSYALINDENATNEVLNSCKFDKNMIISGPNASGKTTVLKSTLINIILSQQFGCGFYQECKIHPYSHIHSYLNIPDTSERDSLFQAESRRCKDIIDLIESYPESKGYRHFCIFDELYSGTNPEEASRSGYAFLTYLDQHPNVNYMLTTHYIYICKKYKSSKCAQNYKMNAIIDKNGKIIFKYKLKKGISKLRGAIHILQNMNYPSKILENIKSL